MLKVLIVYPMLPSFEQLALMGYEKLSQKLTFYKAFFSPQWKFLIHTILQYLSSKTNAWNEFSSTMASAIICLATNQKFNFSKYIFQSMVKNLDNLPGKFLMYLRFVQVFLNQQLDEGQLTRIYDAPSHTKKIFGNMKRMRAVNERWMTNLGKGLPTTANSHSCRAGGHRRQKTWRDSIALITRFENVSKLSNDPLLARGGGPRRQETMGDTIAQTRSENVSKLSNDPLLARGNTLQSGEDSLKLQELMELCTNLQQQVLDLEQTKTTQAEEIIMESFDEEGLGEEDASKQGRIADIDADAGINLVSTHFDDDTDMFGVHDLVCDEVVVESEVVVKAGEKRNVVDAASTTPVSTTIIIDVEITLAQALPMVEQVKLMKRLEQMRLDEELAFKLQAEEEEEERLAREKSQQIKEVNIAWDDVQAKVEADYQLAQRLQAQEQE
ncbi:hypothetical protein Tco_0193825 [Tanacetum coccineum]